MGEGKVTSGLRLTLVVIPRSWRDVFRGGHSVVGGDL